MEEKKNDSRVAILVALIGLCGVLGAALITSWDKIFPPANPGSGGNTSPDSGNNQPADPCSGIEVGEFCWYLGAEDLSCDVVCADHGGYQLATRTYSGSDGSPENCRDLLGSLGLIVEDFYETTQGGIGCFAIQITSGNYYGYWDTQPTTASATSATPGRRRVCACQR